MFARFEVLNEGVLGQPIDQLGSNLDPQARERVFNIDQIVWWTGGGAAHCVIAMTNGQVFRVATTDSILEALTGTSPHILGNQWDSKVETKRN